MDIAAMVTAFVNAFTPLINQAGPPIFGVAALVAALGWAYNKLTNTGH